MPEKKVLFIVKSLYTMERMGVMLMSALAGREGWETDLAVVDAQPYAAILEKIRTWRPSLLAFSVMSSEYDTMEGVIRQLHEDTGLFILVGGPHPTFFQDIVEEPFIHAVAFGEGDRSFPAFLRKFGSGQDFADTPGFHFHLDGQVTRNAPWHLVEDLDEIPFADRALMVKADARFQAIKDRTFLASRGCPNACTYCFNHKYNRMFREYGTMLRRRSVENLIREMEEVKNRWGMDFAFIVDDILTLCPTEWIREFSEKYPARVGVPFICQIHVNYVDEEKIVLLKKAGCSIMCFGIETGDEAVANGILKRKIRNEKIEEVVGLLQKHRILFMTQNILALPVEHPLQVDLQTLDLNIRLRPAYAVAQLFYPLPGTDLTGYALEKGFLRPDAPLPERTNSYSALEFPSRQEKIRVQRLHKLFGLMVSFRFLRPLAPLLIRLPLMPVYSFFYVIWYGYSMRFRLIKSKKSFSEVGFFLSAFFRSLSSFVRKPSARLTGKRR